MSLGRHSDSGRPSGFTLIEMLVVIAAIGILAALLLPGLASSRRASNERAAMTSIKTLTSAQADFRANDRDGNGVHDFWTGDVAGLARWGLIEQGVAEADWRPIHPLAPKPLPFHGYFFVVMKRDESESPPENLQIDTDRKSGKVHHLAKFGFCAFPETFGSTGHWSYIVNQNNTVRWERHNGDFLDYWPSDEELRHDWAIGD